MANRNEAAWLSAFQKGSKQAQNRLMQIHKNNPEFQDFVHKHGFGGNLSAKQSEKQKKSSVVTVPPADKDKPEMQKGPSNRELMIKQAAEKLRLRRQAASNRVAFGSELGGGFVMPHSSFRTYREHLEEQKKKLDKLGFPAMKKDDPQLPAPKDGHPVPKGYERVKDNMGFNVLRKIRSESKENRERVMSYDSAIVTTSKKLPKLTVDPKNKLRKLLNRIGALGAKKLLSTESIEMTNKESLNELRKSTLASYLQKAGSRIRSGTKLGQDFENNAYKDMAVANKHHPNMVTPGFEKDPEELAKAEKNMKTNFDLANTFKRDAANRIKGIARAGRLLTKEEVESLDERNTESHPSLWDTHALVHDSGKVLEKGAKVKGFRGTYKITGFEMPHHSGSTGRVYTDKGSFFPSVVNAKIVKRDTSVKEEVEEVNEISRGVIAKLATARYNQAQAALKQKDFHGYVNKMQKAIKAGDSTTPKTGWSPEEDPKNEEVVKVDPVEKYRQVREALVRRKGK